MISLQQLTRPEPPSPPNLEEDDTPPPPIATRPEKTKSIVSRAVAVITKEVFLWLAGLALCFNDCLVSPLRAKFYGKHKNVSKTYIIPQHWHTTSSWSPSSCKTRTCIFYIVNIIVADVQATQGARASATMIMTMLNWNNSVFAH